MTPPRTVRASWRSARLISRGHGKRLLAATIVAVLSQSCKPDQRSTCPFLAGPRECVCEETSRCRSVVDRHDVPTDEGSFILTGCQWGRRIEAAFSVSWELTAPSPVHFEWAGTAVQDDVFPVHGAVCQLFGCIPGRGPVRFMAEFLMSPSGYQWAVPAADHALVPLVGVATIDGAFHASATIDPPDATYGAVSLGEVPKVTVRVGRTGEPPAELSGLREGSAFAWGNHRASVVRVLEPSARVVGWVEVALSDPAAPGGRYAEAEPPGP